MNALIDEAFAALKCAKEQERAEKWDEAYKDYVTCIVSFIRAYGSIEDARSRDLVCKQMKHIFESARNTKKRCSNSVGETSVSWPPSEIMNAAQCCGIDIFFSFGICREEKKECPAPLPPHREATNATRTMKAPPPSSMKKAAVIVTKGSYVKAKDVGFVASDDITMTFDATDVLQIRGAKDGQWFLARLVREGIVCDGHVPRSLEYVEAEPSSVPPLLRKISERGKIVQDLSKWREGALGSGQINARIVDAQWRNLLTGGKKVFFKVQVRRSRDAGPDQKWMQKFVWRRFTDFRSLYLSLRKQFPGLKSSKGMFPPRLVFGPFPKIVGKRRIALGDWLRVLLEEEGESTLRVMLASHALLRFLGWQAGA